MVRVLVVAKASADSAVNLVSSALKVLGNEGKATTIGKEEVPAAREDKPTRSGKKSIQENILDLFLSRSNLRSDDQIWILRSLNSRSLQDMHEFHVIKKLINQYKVSIQIQHLHFKIISFLLRTIRIFLSSSSLPHHLLLSLFAYHSQFPTSSGNQKTTASP